LTDGVGYRKPKHDRRGFPVVRVPGPSPEEQPERRRLKVMADYSAFPVWDISGTGPFGWQFMVNPETLPISSRLRADLWAWAAVYENPSRRQSLKEWYAQGRRIARDLEAELGPDCEVVFSDEKGEEESIPNSN
jgi:hypothetical protein